METARALTENLVVLLRREHHALAEFLVALADFDERRRWVELGHSSLFYFLHRELRLSKGAAQYRKVAAELIQRVPGVVEPLREGRLCLTSIIEAARVVTAENWETVLPRFYGLSKREAMEVVAALQPHPAPPTRSVVTAVRTAVVTAVRPAPAMQSVTTAAPALALGEASEPRRAQPEPDLARPASQPGWPDEPTPSTDPAGRSRPAVRGRAAHRRAEPPPRDGVEPVPAQARGRPRCAVSRTPGRHARGDPRGGAGPAPGAGGEAEGDGREAQEGNQGFEGRPHPGPRPA